MLQGQVAVHGGFIWLCLLCMFLKEKLLDPGIHVDLSHYYRSKGGSRGEDKTPARGPRAVEEEEEDDEEEEAGEKRQIRCLHNEPPS